MWWDSQVRGWAAVRLVWQVSAEVDPADGYRSEGSVYETMVVRREMLITRYTRLCTAELKLFLLLRILGWWLGGTAGPWGQRWADFTSGALRSVVSDRPAPMTGRGAVRLIGLRTDEPRRVERILLRAVAGEGVSGPPCDDGSHTAGEYPVMPIADAGWTADDIVGWWARQPHDLAIPSDAGNCVYGCACSAPSSQAAHPRPSSPSSPSSASAAPAKPPSPGSSRLVGHCFAEATAPDGLVDSVIDADGDTATIWCTLAYAATGADLRPWAPLDAADMTRPGAWRSPAQAWADHCPVADGSSTATLDGLRTSVRTWCGRRYHRSCLPTDRQIWAAARAAGGLRPRPRAGHYTGIRLTGYTSGSSNSGG